MNCVKASYFALQFLLEFPRVKSYGNKTVIISWTETPIGFVIKGREVAKSNMNFFELLWKIAK
ncbi:MAG TPA: hypothetical protein VJJ53_00735 [Candidatus Nanoarchaeia archaeon]|nr:hypothetical protein [Candidatus Nanoarchaeia archaeon]